MDLNDIIKKCATKCGVASSVYATADKANFLLDDIDNYPVILRLFQDAIYESNSGLAGFVKRDITLCFYDILGEVEADTELQVAPMAERMLSLAWRFISELRNEGVEVVVRVIRPTTGRYDAILVGVQCELTITYKVCANYGNSSRDCR